MYPSPFTEEVTYRRAALLLGLAGPDEIHAWAEATLDAEPTPPDVLIEAVLAPRELTALRAALAPAAIEPEPPTVVQRLLAVTAADVRSGRRSVGDTMHVLAQMRRMVAVSPEIGRAIDDLAGDHMLAKAGVRGDVAVEEARVAEWLERHAGPA